jgi:hypothetical protein
MRGVGMKNNITPSKAKTVGESFFENLAFLIVVGFFAVLLERLVSFLFTPFQSYSRGMFEDLVNKEIENKKSRRARRQEKFDNDESDPMHQYQLRFLTDAENYKRDLDNAVYFAWYKEWKAGNVLDTMLKWAPSVETKMETINPNFLDYLEIQMNLHKKLFGIKNDAFLSNIRHCYPEFTPTFEGIETDLCYYREEVVEEDLHEELHSALAERGLCDELVTYLEEKSLSPTKVKKAMKIFLACQNAGYNARTAIAVYENGIDVTSQGVEVVDNLLNKLHMTRHVCDLFIRQEISGDDLTEICLKVAKMKQTFGDEVLMSQAPEGGNYLYELIEQTLQEILVRKRSERINQICDSQK